MSQLPDALEGMNTHLRRFLRILTRTGELRVSISQWLGIIGADLEQEQRELVLKLLEQLAETQDDQVEALISLQEDVIKIRDGIREFDKVLEEYAKRLQERGREDVGRRNTEDGASTGPGIEGLAATDCCEDCPGI